MKLYLNMELITKTYLSTDKINRSIYPKKRPSFNEWIKEIYSRNFNKNKKLKPPAGKLE